MPLTMYDEQGRQVYTKFELYDDGAYGRVMVPFRQLGNALGVPVKGERIDGVMVGIYNP